MDNHGEDQRHLASTAREPPLAPTRSVQFVNFVFFQAAWFAAVLGAAHHVPLLGVGCVAAVIAWHLWVSARPTEEAKLVAISCAIGFAVESLRVILGHVAYPSGQPISFLAPYWMVALWGELAIALNVTMRWLKRRPGLAAILGAIAGPAAFSSGARLGGASFVDVVPALFTLSCIYALALPTLMALSIRYDGVMVPDSRGA